MKSLKATLEDSNKTIDKIIRVAAERSVSTENTVLDKNDFTKE